MRVFFIGMAVAMLLYVVYALAFMVVAGAEQHADTPTPTPMEPCADDEERLVDGTCQFVPPSEEMPPKRTPTPTIGTSMTQAPVFPSALPNTGGESEHPCRDWTTGQAGGTSTPCMKPESFFERPGILLTIMGLLLGALVIVAAGRLYRRGTV